MAHEQGASPITTERLRAFIDWIERLAEERKGISDDINEVFAEAKDEGFDIKIIRQVLKIRKLTTPDRENFLPLLELYTSIASGEVGRRTICQET